MQCIIPIVRLEKFIFFSSEGIWGLLAYYFSDTSFSNRNILFDCCDYIVKFGI
jgi:hypothetical protein